MQGLILTIVLLTALSVEAATINISPGQTIQSGIDQAVDGDIVEISAGEFNEDIDFKGKKITIRGQGQETIIRGSGIRSVVGLVSGEDQNTILENLQIERGIAERGGGIIILNSCPIIRGCSIIRNQSEDEGSGIYIGGTCADGTSATISNNLLARNVSIDILRGAPAVIEVLDSSPLITNNTITRNQNTAIKFSENSAPTIQNNILAFNGFRRGARFRRAFGIDAQNITSTSPFIIQNNINTRNRQGFFRQDRRRFRKVNAAEAFINSADFSNNIGSNPRLVNRRKLNVSLRSNSPAINAGNADPSFNDADGSRNDIGLTGGPNPHPDF